MCVHPRPRTAVKQNYSLAFFSWNLWILLCKILPGKSLILNTDPWNHFLELMECSCLWLTTYALTLILTGPCGVWKYKSISTYPEMDAFPVTWTKLTCCQSLMGVCILMSDFCEIRVMLDPESIITLVRFLSRKLMVAGTWAAWEPRKEYPGGCTWCFFNSTSGLELQCAKHKVGISAGHSPWCFMAYKIFLGRKVGISCNISINFLLW